VELVPKPSVLEVDVRLEHARGDDYDAIVVPGEQINPDLLRINDKALPFVRAFRRTQAARCLV
jgi:protease I